MRGPEFSGPQPGRGAERAGQTTPPPNKRLTEIPALSPPLLCASPPALALTPGAQVKGPGGVRGNLEAASADRVPRAACGLHCHLPSCWFSVGSWGEAEGGTICGATGA